MLVESSLLTVVHHHADGEEVSVAKGRNELPSKAVLHQGELAVVAEEDLVVLLVRLGDPHTPRTALP